MYNKIVNKRPQRDPYQYYIYKYTTFGQKGKLEMPRKSCHSEPSKPIAGRRIHRGSQGGTYTLSPRGNKEYFGNNGKHCQ